MDQIQVKAYKLTDNVEVGKFTALVLDDSVYPDGVAVPGGANAGPIAGIATESALPQGFSDYTGGLYNIVSGTAWPSGALPTSIVGRGISVHKAGIIRCVAAAAIDVGDEVNIADSQGRIKTVDEAGGTLVYIIGQAEEAAGQANDVIRVSVNLIRRKT